MTLTPPNSREQSATLAPVPPVRRWGGLALRLLVSVALLVTLLSGVDLRGVLAVVAEADARLLALLLTMFVGERCLGAYRWHLLLRTQAMNVSFATTLRATFLGGFVGTFLPGGVGVEAVRVAAMTRAANLASAASSVLFDRILGSLALVSVVLVALAVTPEPVQRAIPVAAWTSLAILIAMSAVLIHPRLSDGLQRFVRSHRLARLRRKTRQFVAAVQQMKHRPVVLLQVAGLSVLFQMLRVSIAPVAAVALGLEIPLTLMLIYVPIIMFLMMLPISIAGLGVREAAFVYFFGIAYITPEQAIGLSLMIGLFTLVVQLPGAVVCLTGVRPRSQRQGVAASSAAPVPHSR